MPKMRGRIPITNVMIRTAKKRKPVRKRAPPPPINLVQRNIPSSNNRLVGETIFYSDAWCGLLGRNQEWMPSEAVKNALRERGRK